MALGKGAIIALSIAGALVLLTGSCGIAGFSWYTGKYNGLVNSSQDVDRSLSNIDEGYRRRADLLPNLASAVESEVGAEQDLTVEYAKARAAQGGSIKLTPETLKDPVAMKAYQANQAAIGTTIGRLMSIAEKIPDPKFSQGFSELRAAIEGSENRISIAIRDYNDKVSDHNKLSLDFMGSYVAQRYPMFGQRAYFKVEEEKKAVPNIKMNTRMSKKD